MERLELGGIWTLTRVSDGSERPMTVPGDLLSALIAAGEVADPLYGKNELALQWIGREDWIVSHTVDVPASLLACQNVFIDFESIDTMADVRINGQVVGQSGNMFRRFRVDAGSVLKPGANTVAVTIRSPERIAAERAANLPYPIPASTYPVSSPHRNLVRKAQCMGGWDWGPCLMTGGIYDSAAIVGVDGPRIEYLRANVNKAPEKKGTPSKDFLVEVTLELHTGSDLDTVVELELAGAKSSRRLIVAAGESIVRETLRIAGPELWWPAGYGSQPLYGLRAVVRPASGIGQQHEMTKHIGFRDLRIDALEDKDGKSMTIVVNGTRIFAKGANWIPADALPSRWTQERYADLLDSAAAANMNCLRVWGGGRYESDAFYDQCDELGILVWQDCMFSCALYPSSGEFLSDVEAEIRHQIKRLANHPALALWCGNNEALGAITWYDESKNNPARYIVDYDRLTEGTVGRIVRELDPGRTWWPSSPSAGPDDFSDNWHADNRGDMHFWSVWHEGKPFSEYMTIKPRFCSEFGFQSFPSYATIATFAPEGERNVSSPIMEHHQRHPRGNTIIMETMLRYFRMPKGFRETLYLSQVQQALAMKTAVEYWRCNRPRCMGALYWQLNDVWPGASWSSLEHDGTWKVLHHEARRFFDPLLLSLFVKDGMAYAYAVNDGMQSLTATLSLTLRRFDGSPVATLSAPPATGISPSILAPESATLLWSLPLAELPVGADQAFIDARIIVTSGAGVTFGAGVGAGNPDERRAVLFLTEPKACTLVEAGITAKVEAVDKNGARSGDLAIRLKTNAPAFYVALSAEGIAGRFSDSGFHLAAGEERVIGFTPIAGRDKKAQAPSAALLTSALRIDDLRSSYD